MKKSPKLPSTFWLKALKELKIDISQLSLKELRVFRDVERYLNEPLPGPPGFQYLLRCFRYLTAFALERALTNKVPALARCWDDLYKRFISTDVFTDGVFVEAWAFCDFPCQPDGGTALDLFQEFVRASGTLDHYAPFISAMRQSRLGLYQEVRSSANKIRFKELISRETVEALRTVDKYEHGEIFLIRIVSLDGEGYLFGDPKCWPKEVKDYLIDMVFAKLYYFDRYTDGDSFPVFMKYAGPYWMSCAVQDPSFPILPPDHYLTYLKPQEPVAK